VVKVSGHTDAVVSLFKRVNEHNMRTHMVLAHVNAIVVALGLSMAGGERSASGCQP